MVQHDPFRGMRPPTRDAFTNAIATPPSLDSVNASGVSHQKLPDDERKFLVDTVKDAPGPPHDPEVEHLDIEGAIRERFPSVDYRDGTLTEVVNDRWRDMYEEPVEHIYFIVNHGGAAREEWYVHRQVTDRYVLVSGAVTVALFDDRPNSPSFEMVVIAELGGLDEGGFSGLKIPPGVWHSLRPTSERVVLMNTKFPAYNRENPDKYRMPMPNERCSFEWLDTDGAPPR